jgi:methionyl-tRNA synthetase
VHIKVEQKISAVLRAGDITRANTKDVLHAVRDFWTQTHCQRMLPDCRQALEGERERRGYFFRNDKYQDWLIDYIENIPTSYSPVPRQREAATTSCDRGLQDIVCASAASSFKWGVPAISIPSTRVRLDRRADHYITALGYGSTDDTRSRNTGRADVHLFGARRQQPFHTINWTHYAARAGLPLPKQVIRARMDAVPATTRKANRKATCLSRAHRTNATASNALRYYIMREIAFGSDGNYIPRIHADRLNSDLAN